MRICLLFALSGAVLFAAPESAVEAEVRARVAELDHAEFPRREAAARRLVEIGSPALPALRSALASDAAERRHRARQVLERIQLQRIREGFAELASGEADIEQGMFLIALMLDAELTKASVDARLDALARSVREKLDPPLADDPAEIGAAEAARALVVTLRDEAGLAGDHENYDHPDNSSVHRVLEQGDGLPILLSEIAVAVGRRAGLDVHGLAYPGRYLLVCRGGAPGRGEPERLIIDPHGAWRPRDPADVARVMGRIEAPAPNAVLERMLSNLASDCLEVGDPRMAAMVVECRRLFEARRPNRDR